MELKKKELMQDQELLSLKSETEELEREVRQKSETAHKLQKDLEER